jgi:hypothetical protein
MMAKGEAATPKGAGKAKSKAKAKPQPQVTLAGFTSGRVALSVRVGEEMLEYTAVYASTLSTRHPQHAVRTWVVICAYGLNPTSLLRCGVMYCLGATQCVVFRKPLANLRGNPTEWPLSSPQPSACHRYENLADVYTVLEARETYDKDEFRHESVNDSHPIRSSLDPAPTGTLHPQMYLSQFPVFALRRCCRGDEVGKIFSSALTTCRRASLPAWIVACGESWPSAVHRCTSLTTSHPALFLSCVVLSTCVVACGGEQD